MGLNDPHPSSKTRLLRYPQGLYAEMLRFLISCSAPTRSLDMIPRDWIINCKDVGMDLKLCMLFKDS